jgi:hypothetical protein
MVLGWSGSYREDVFKIKNLAIGKGLAKVHLYSSREVKEIQVGIDKKSISFMVSIKETNSSNLA